MQQFVGSNERPVEDLGVENPVIFTDDEFTEFGYQNEFNSRNLWVQNLGNYYRDIDSFDENVNFRVKDIKQSEKVFKRIFSKKTQNILIFVFDTDEIKYRLASGTVGIQHATNEVIEEGELPMMIAVYIVIIILVLLLT